MRILVDSWYGAQLPFPTLEDERLPGRLRRAVDSSELVRGIVLWWVARRYELLALGGWGTCFKTVVALERLLGRRGPYLVVLQFIYVPEECWVAVGQRSRGRASLRRAAQRWIVAPVLRRALARAHVLSSWERERNAEVFGVEPDLFAFLAWPLAAAGDALPGYAGRGRRVVASGRTLCDWPTVFAAARDQGWDLEVVCAAEDRRRVDALNHDGVANVRQDMPIQEYRDLVRAAAVHLVAVVPCAASSGQRRIEDAVRGGTPLVVSGVPGVADYVQDGETGLVFAPGDAGAARDAVNALLADAERCERLRRAALERATRWTRADYMAGIAALIETAKPAARA